MLRLSALPDSLSGIAETFLKPTKYFVIVFLSFRLKSKLTVIIPTQEDIGYAN
jgi:hypothetical protein